MNALIIGRVLAGMGGNGMYLGVMTLLSVNTSDRERPGYLSFVGLVWGIGTVLGPVVGGAFVESPATWRWAFYINLCVAGLFAPVYLFWIPSFKPRAGARALTLAREFDILGTVLSIGAITAVIMATNLGGTLYSWNSGQIIALFVVSFSLFILFGVQQTYTVFTSLTTRIFPIQFMKNWNAVLLFCCAAAVNAASFIPIYYVPLYFQFTRGDSAIMAAVRLLPLIFVLSAAILANGHLMARFGYFQPWYIFGSVLTLIGGVLMCKSRAPAAFEANPLFSLFRKKLTPHQPASPPPHPKPTSTASRSSSASAAAASCRPATPSSKPSRRPPRWRTPSAS
jgi:MFS family permease